MMTAKPVALSFHLIKNHSSENEPAKHRRRAKGVLPSLHSPIKQFFTQHPYLTCLQGSSRFIGHDRHTRIAGLQPILWAHTRTSDPPWVFTWLCWQDFATAGLAVSNERPHR